MGKDIEILERRRALYERAKQQHPEKWSEENINWKYQEKEWLNPEQSERINETRNQEVKAS